MSRKTIALWAMRWPEMLFILGRSGTQYVAMVTKLLSSYCGAPLVEYYSKESNMSDTNNNNGICSGISTRWLFIHRFQIELEFRSVDFCGGKKTGEPREKPSDQGREPTTNSTHM